MPRPTPRDAPVTSAITSVLPHHSDDDAPGWRRHHLVRAAPVRGALDEAFFREVGEVLVDRGERREAEAAADLLEARRVAVLADELVQVIEDLPLTFCEWQHHEPRS